VTGAANLRLQELTVFYGHARAVWRVGIQAPAGKITAILGPNGAGKSSILLATYGAVKSQGQVFLDDRDISRLAPMARARVGISLVPQGRQVFPTLTVRENLVVMCRLLGVGLDRIETAYDRFPILKERSRQMAGVLSGGEQQMLAVSRALLGSPRIVLLDEMTTGLAPQIVDMLMETTRQLAAGGAAILMAEPSIGAIYASIDRGYVVMRGEVVGQAAGGQELQDMYQKALGMELAGVAVD
jgi:branched-chain amino acid transport system ATP-binding protein